MTNAPAPQGAPDSILARIRKLSRMTTANGCTEAEAMSAAALLDRLMREHNLTQGEVEIRHEANRCVTETFTEIVKDRRQAPLLDGCLMSIAKLFSCKVWFGTELEDLGLDDPVPTLSVRFFGLPTDASAALAMCEVLFSAVATESQRFQATLPKGRKHAAAREDALYSFRAGICGRVAERLRSLAGKAPIGKGLLVLKDQLVNDAFAALGLNLRTGRCRPVHDAVAYAKGQMAGAGIDLAGQRLPRGLRRLTAGA